MLQTPPILIFWYIKTPCFYNIANLNNLSNIFSNFYNTASGSRTHNIFLLREAPLPVGLPLHVSAHGGIRNLIIDGLSIARIPIPSRGQIIRSERLELSRTRHQDLNLKCLPIPPRAHKTKSEGIEPWTFYIHLLSKQTARPLAHSPKFVVKKNRKAYYCWDWTSIGY